VQAKEGAMPDVKIVKGYIPGAIGRVAEMHGTYYHRHWGFGLFFEAMVATELSAFLGRYDEKRDGFWTAVAGESIEGSIAIDGLHAADEGAHLRWFIMSDAWRGKGFGNQLLSSAIGFCRSAGHKGVSLWTFEGLHAARHLYEKYGFMLVEQQKGARWGREVTEQRLELRL
jgi:GNAT superfamily N-acetyltransferase